MVNDKHSKERTVVMMLAERKRTREREMGDT